MIHVSLQELEGVKVYSNDDDHLLSLSPISPLSPFSLTSPGMRNLPYGEPAISHSKIAMQKSKSYSPHSSPLPPASDFEQYLATTFDSMDKQELIFESEFSSGLTDWLSHPLEKKSMVPGSEALNIPKAQHPDSYLHKFSISSSPSSRDSSDAIDNLPSLSSSLSSQSLLKKSPKTQGNSETFNFQNTQQPQTRHRRSGSLQTGSLPSSSQSKHVTSDSNSSASTFSSGGFSEKQSVGTQVTRSSSLSSGHSRNSSHNKPFDPVSSIAPASLKPLNLEKLNQIKVPKKSTNSFNEDTMADISTVSSATTATETTAGHKYQKSVNDIVGNIEPPNTFLSSSSKNDYSLENPYSGLSGLGNTTAALKDLSQNGLMISTPVPPPRSKYRNKIFTESGNISKLVDSSENSKKVFPTSNSSASHSLTTNEDGSSPRSFNSSSIPGGSIYDTPNSGRSFSSSSSSAKKSKSSKGTKSSRNSKISPKMLSKELPELPPQAIAVSRENSNKKKSSTSSSPSPKNIPPMPSGLSESRVTSIYDWDCITKNLDKINLSLGKWDQADEIAQKENGFPVGDMTESKNKKSKTPGSIQKVPGLFTDYNFGSGSSDIPNYSFQTGKSSQLKGKSSNSSSTSPTSVPVSQESPESQTSSTFNGSDSSSKSVTAPRAIDMTFMERSTPLNKEEQLARKQSVKGYDLTKHHSKTKLKHHKKSSSASNYDFQSDDFKASSDLSPPPLKGHKKSASTIASPSSIYGDEYSPLTFSPQVYKKSSLSKEFDGAGNNENGIVFPKNAKDAISHNPNFPSQKPNIPLQAMSIPSFHHNPHQSVPVPPKNRYTSRGEYIEDEALLPAPPSHEALNIARQSFQNLQHRQSQQLPASSPYLLEKASNSASRLARNAVNAASNPRESFTTSFTEAISMPSPVPKSSPNMHGTIGALPYPKLQGDLDHMDNHKRNTSSSSIKLTPPLRLRSKSVSAASFNSGNTGSGISTRNIGSPTLINATNNVVGGTFNGVKGHPINQMFSGKIPKGERSISFAGPSPQRNPKQQGLSTQAYYLQMLKEDMANANLGLLPPPPIHSQNFDDGDNQLHGKMSAPQFQNPFSSSDNQAEFNTAKSHRSSKHQKKSTVFSGSISPDNVTDKTTPPATLNLISAYVTPQLPKAAGPPVVPYAQRQLEKVTNQKQKKHHHHHHHHNHHNNNPEPQSPISGSPLQTSMSMSHLTSANVSPSMSDAIVTPVTTIVGNETSSRNGSTSSSTSNSKWKWKRPSLNLGRKH